MKAIPILVANGLALTMVWSAGAATTYYVDFDEGSDERAGTSPETAWRTLPGTRTAAGSSWRQTSWGGGVISSSRKVPAGTVLKLKSGTVHGQANGGRIQIDSMFYANGTSNSPVRIERDPTWGSGSVRFDGAGVTLNRWEDMILVLARDHVHLDGVSGVTGACDGLVFENIAPESVLSGVIRALGTSEDSMLDGFQLLHVKIVTHSSYSLTCHQLVVQRCKNFVVADCEFDGNSAPMSQGVLLGDSGRGNDSGRLLRCRSHHHGSIPRGGSGGTNVRIGFITVDSHNVDFEQCEAYDNQGDGFDSGTVSDRRLSDNIRFVGCRSTNCDDGFGFSAADVDGDSRFTLDSCLSVGNLIGIRVYEGPAVNILQCTVAGNKWGLYVNAPAQQARSTFVGMTNCIVAGNYTATAGADLYYHTVTDLVLAADYNLYDQHNGTQAFCVWNDSGVGATYYYSTNNTRSIARWRADRSVDEHSVDSVQDGSQVRFVDPSARDYHLQEDSGAVVRGFNFGTGYRDLDNVERPSDRAWDLGAYQLLRSPRAPTGLRTTETR